MPSAKKSYIYAISSPEKPKTIYIGQTKKTIEERFEEHKTEENEPEKMKEFLATYNSSVRPLAICLVLEDLDELERKFIEKYANDGYEMLNQKLVPKVAETKEPAVTKVVVKEVSIQKPQPHDHTSKYYWYVKHDGKRKEFYYGKSAENKAKKLKEAQEYCDKIYYDKGGRI